MVDKHFQKLSGFHPHISSFLITRPINLEFRPTPNSGWILLFAYSQARNRFKKLSKPHIALTYLKKSVSKVYIAYNFIYVSLSKKDQLC